MRCDAMRCDAISCHVCSPALLRWRPGWLRKEQVETISDDNNDDGNNGESLDRSLMQVCKDCQGKGTEPCLLCAGYNVIDI